MDMGGWEEGAGEANGESSKEAYTLPHIKQTTNGDSLYDSGSSNQGSVNNLEGWERMGSGRVTQEGGDMCTPVANSC